MWKVWTNLQTGKLMYNGATSNAESLSFIKSRMKVAQMLPSLSCKICSTTLSKFLAFGLFVLVSEISTIAHQWLVAKLRGHLRFVNTVQTKKRKEMHPSSQP